ncbi:helix-turn-helix domain-containing protein [Euryhalocaulis caribicus]|uniref:helix-turn-helix domain-containing protein n=1 Tax=Euryhalocaulis caribicus TaxID=1161401 RepID=UPI0019D6C29F|nr:helix-turn-helix domain-containing protein [Euryhalocaulis caribicus]
MSVCACCQERIDALQARIGWLEGVLSGGEEFVFPESWRLSLEKRAILTLFLKNPVVTVWTWEVSREIRGLAELDNPNNSFKAHLCALRRKLKPHGLTITNHYGRGYQLEDREAWRARLTRTLEMPEAA